MHLLCLSYLTCDSPRDSAPYYDSPGLEGKGRKGKEREGRGMDKKGRRHQRSTDHSVYDRAQDVNAFVCVLVCVFTCPWST